MTLHSCRKSNIALFLVLLGFVLPNPVNAAVTLITEDTPPANYLDRAGKPAGLAVELVQEMARRVGDPGVVQVVPWARGYKDAQENADTALFHTVWTLERDRLFQWVGPLFPTEIVFYRKAGVGPRINTLDDARKVRAIGTYKDDAKEQLLKKMGFANLESTVDDSQNPKKLVAGRIDLWPVNTLQVKSMLESGGLPADSIEPALTMTRQQAYLAFSPKTDPRLVAKWQTALDEMEQDGTADSIRAKYGLKTQKTIQIFTEEDPPRNFVQDGVLKGHAVEIVRQMLHRATDGSRITVASWSRGYRETLENPDTALFSIARTPEREKLFQWVGPIYHTRLVFLARKGAGVVIRNLDDARKVKAIGTYKDDVGEQYLKANGFTNLDSGVSAELVPKKLADGRVDLWITPDDTAPILAKQAGLDSAGFETVYTVVTFDSCVGVSHKTSPAVVRRWQEALNQMRKDGTFDRIMKQGAPVP